MKITEEEEFPSFLKIKGFKKEKEKPKKMKLKTPSKKGKRINYEL
jgi:hypothetical protein